jgi:GAF domain-containing protein
MQCPRCQQDNPSLAKFCLACGIPVSDPTSQARTDTDLKGEIEGLRRSLGEALDHQIATSEILRVISSSPTDVRPVFDAIARNAVLLCGGIGAVVLRFDGEVLHVAGHHNVGSSGVERLEQRYPRRPGRDFPPGRAFLDRAVVHVPDLQAATEFAASTARDWGAGSQLSVPLLREQEAIGVIGLSRDVVGPFSPEQITVLQTFADQAVIAIENVRLFKETTEALEQQTATGEILRVISTSPTDLQLVLDAVVQSAARFCGADDAELFRLDGEHLKVAAHHGPIPAPVGRLIPVVQGSVSGRAFAERRAIHVADLQAEAEEFPVTSGMARELGFRASLSVPLLREGMAVGTITLRRAEVSLFTDKQIALLKTFADQAVIAIENVRLFTELQARNRDLTATGEILRVISTSPTNVQPVLDVMAESAARLCEAPDVSIFLREADHLRVAARHGLIPSDATLPLKGTGVGWAVLQGHTVHVADIQAEVDRFALSVDNARRLGFRTVLNVPLMRDGAAIGAISLRRSEAQLFTEREVALLETFANQAVIAIENVRLFSELQASNRDLTRALDQQTATSEVLKVISRSAFALEPVLETLLENAVRLCGANRGSVYRFDGDVLRHAISCNVPPETAEFFDRNPIAPGRHSVAARAALERRTQHIPDILTDPDYTFGVRQVEPIRTALAVPMMKGDDLLGVFTIWKLEVQPFSDRQIEMVTTFADQAVIAIENVRLFQELERRNRALTRALDQQTATSEILRTIAHTQTDVQPVFDTIVRSALRLCNGATAAVFRVDGEMLHHPANYGGSPEALAAARARYPRPVGMDSIPGIAILTRSEYEVPDTEGPAALEMSRETGRILGIRSLVAVPMLRDEDAVGAIVVTRPEPGRFTAAEMSLLKTFADQAVIAIENVRLFRELNARTHELTRSVDELRALGEVSQAISSTLDLETVLTTIVSQAVRLSGLDGGVVFEYDEDAEEFIHRAATEVGGALAAARRATRVRKGEGVVGRTAITLGPLQVPDITLPGAHESRLRENLIESGIRAVLAVPMVREGRLIGSLVVSRNQPGDFPTETVALLRTFATQSALAIQNARLFHEIADKSRQLEAASQHKSEFLANMSHELRTPLNAIIGFSEVLMQRMFGGLNEKQDEYLKDIHDSGRHLLSLINDILDLSKIEAGRMELELTGFDLPAAIDSALTLVRERAMRRGITLRRAIDERVGQVQADERKVRQVVLNLLSNAIKFTPEGGRIEVRTRPSGQAIEVSVTDTGIGIAPEDQEAVFEEFRQVGSADKKAEGTGLGLTLCRKFVELHGGTIWVTSAVGAGSTFTFKLPVRPWPAR